MGAPMNAAKDRTTIHPQTSFILLQNKVHHPFLARGKATA